MGVRVLSDADLRPLLGAREVVDAADLAFKLAAEPGRVRAGQTHYETFADDGFAFVHSAVADGATGLVFKTGTQVPGNRSAGLPTVHATVSVHDADTGETRALLNGNTITTLRTSAGLVSGARALAGDAGVVGVLGAGVQATEFILLAREVLDVERFLIWSPGLEKHGRARLDPRLADVSVEIAESPRSLCEESRVIATCTLSREPVVRGEWVWPGTTIVTMGSYEPDRCELDVDCSARADVTVTDAPHHAVRSTGPVCAAVRAGVLAEGDVLALGEVLRGSRAGRTSDEEIVVFHSNGLGVQDATLAWLAYTRARERNVGVSVDL